MPSLNPDFTICFSTEFGKCICECSFHLKDIFICNMKTYLKVALWYNNGAAQSICIAAKLTVPSGVIAKQHALLSYASPAVEMHIQVGPTSATYRGSTVSIGKDIQVGPTSATYRGSTVSIGKDIQVGPTSATEVQQYQQARTFMKPGQFHSPHFARVIGMKH